MRIHLDAKDISFISKFTHTALWQQDANGLCIVSPKSGARVLKKHLQGLAPIKVNIPEALLLQLTPGYYDFEETAEYTVMSVYMSATGDSPNVAFRVENSLQAENFDEYIRLASADGYDSSIPAKALLTMYSVITSTNSALAHTIEFSKGLAYFSSPQIVCVLNKEIADRNDFAINKDNMWFLSFANNPKMLLTSTYVCLRDVMQDTIYCTIFYKLKIGNVPPIERLQNLTPLQSRNVNLTHFASILQRIKTDRHNPPKIVFKKNGFAIIKLHGITTVIPTEAQQIDFAIDAMTFKNIAMKVSGTATLTLYPRQFSLKNKDLTIVGRWEES